jgi:membrane fusion protein (multidrug efflux system)
MNALQDKAAIASGASAEIAVVVARQSKRKLIGILLCLGAVVVVTGGWAMALSSGATSTDNAYVRGDVTALAAKVAGYVTALEVEDNQSVRAGEVLFRIDDRDYRARLAQAAGRAADE